ncbi:MAG TPA: NAD(P)-dependent oxidoreductase [Steroidobacteraceae bacterium]|nr:NAD(P)-dependent oxidoreductase [Steroidobacteraceae bacterium]
MSVLRRVLVTGAGGFIGRWSLAPLRAAGFEVHAVLSPRAAPAAGSLGGISLHRADLLDARGIDALIETVRPSHLLHFAWIATPGEYWQSADNYRWLAASAHLLRSFRRGGGVRAVMAGSCAEYDWSRASVCDERTTPLADGPNVHATPYTECKVAMARTLEEFGRAHRLSTAWGRIFFQFGPDEDPRRLVSSVINDLLSGRAAACSHGRQIRSFLHVQDVGAAFARLLGTEVEGPVNIGSGDRIAIADLLERIAERIGRRDLLQLGARPSPPSEPALLVPDIGRLRNEVDFQPRWTLDTGLDDTILWWRNTLAGREGAA